MSDIEQNKVTDESDDRKYFTISPRLVWALSRTPYDFMLWCVIKDIAGEKGECYLSTPDLAALGMMSVGKAQECRKYLIKEKLISCDLRKDPGYPQPVCHIKVLNLWAANIAWCEAHSSIASRLEFKKERSSGESNQKSSPSEKGHTPREKGGISGETKNIHLEDQKESANSANHAPSLSKDETLPFPDPPLTDEEYEAEERAREVPQEKPEHPPAVMVFRSVRRSYPPKETWAMIDSAVGSEQRQLDLWRDVLTGYAAMGWNPRNVAGALEFFERGEIPKPGNGHGKKQPEGKLSQIERVLGVKFNGRKDADIDDDGNVINGFSRAVPI